MIIKFKKTLLSNKIKTSSLLMLISLSTVLLAKDQGSSELYQGYWLTEDGETIVNISSCNRNNLCGRVAGFNTNEKAETKAKITQEERQIIKDLALICSTDLLGDLKEQSTHWGNGWIMDFETEKKYSLKLTIVKNVLKVRVYEGSESFGENYLWKRAAPPNISCTDILNIANVR